MNINKVIKSFLALCFVCFIAFFGGNLVAKAAAAYAWDGHWSNQNSIYYVNNISSTSRLGSLVNTAALDNINNNQYTVRLVKTNSTTSARHIVVNKITSSSISWTGKAEGANYNWDSNKHYYGVTIKLNTGKPILDYSDAKLKGLIAHEFGHALGLEHRDVSRSYLMYPYDSRTQFTPNSTEDSTLYNHYYHQIR